MLKNIFRFSIVLIVMSGVLVAMYYFFWITIITLVIILFAIHKAPTLHEDAEIPDNDIYNPYKYQ